MTYSSTDEIFRISSIVILGLEKNLNILSLCLTKAEFFSSKIGLISSGVALVSSKKETKFSKDSFLFSIALILSSEAKPIAWDLGVRRKSALSCLNKVLYSALE